jgi:amino acid adenylation domain-containing protein
LLAGHGYVPLNRTFPTERTRIMLERSGARSLIVDEESLAQLDELLSATDHPLLVLLPEGTRSQALRGLRDRWRKHTILGAEDLISHGSPREPAVSADDAAYLLFTSGSTGTPKGVAVSHRNVRHFIDYVVSRYEITEEDRFSQVFDMTFDLSVFDLFVAWERGACVCCPSQKTLIKPGRFIREMELTVWFSVPSTAVFMKKLGALKPNRYPSLRWSLFCGEPLPTESARAWAEAAPNSTLENLYGPTELTIACADYRWNPESSPAESEMGIVPIGRPYPGMEAMVADEYLKEVAPGAEGELMMAGPQMTGGYWMDRERTESAFVVPPGSEEVYYRTGDRVRRPAGDGPLKYLGRVDHQVKILGHRVELGEIEAVVREESGSDGVVAIGWPIVATGYGGVEVFLEGSTAEGSGEGGAEGSEPTLRERVARRLPEYMIPKRYHFMERLPLNTNGKYDRVALVGMLQGGR